jgi:hypothetical protein
MIMAQPMGRPPPGLRHLVDEAQELRERLHRVAIALSITEDMVSEAFERLANADCDGEADYRHKAHLARATADVCRTCAQRLDELRDSQ